LRVALGVTQRAVHRVEREVAEERALPVRADELDRAVGEKIRRVRTGRDGRAVGDDARVGAEPVRVGAADKSRKRVEAPRRGRIRGLVTEMPFAEGARGVARRLQKLREQPKIGGQTPLDPRLGIVIGVSITRRPRRGLRRAFLRLGLGAFLRAGALRRPAPHAGCKRVESRHDRSARRGAERVDAEAREARALAADRVEVRRLEVGFPEAGGVAVPLVVGDDEDDVGARHGSGGENGKKG